MNSKLKGALIFVSGLVIGAGVGVLSCKKYFEARADKEVADVKGAYDERLYELEEGARRSSLDDPDLGSEKAQEEANKADKQRLVKEKIEALNNKPDILTDYTKYFKDSGERLDGVSETIRDAEEAAREEGISMDEEERRMREEIDIQMEDLNNMSREAIKNNTPPYVIEAEEYGLMEAYEKMDLVWYMFDDILSDTADEVVDRELFVRTCIEDSGFDKNDLDVLYVRNDKLMMMFEITKLYESFAH